MMSYMPFNRNVPAGNVQSILDKQGMESINSQRLGSPSRGQRGQKQREGLYAEEEGKNVEYIDRQNDQEEIKQFTENIFANHLGSGSNRHMTFKQYDNINKTISSEMFYSLMAVLHEKLPCSTGYFRLRKKFRDARKFDVASPVRTIASPKMIRGLSIHKEGASAKSFSPDIRIKNFKGSELAK